jgi:hypothetical protein
MTTRAKLIIFFGAVALMILIIGLFWTVRKGAVQASGQKLTTVNPTKIILLIDDHLDQVAPGSISTYTIKVINNGNQDLNNLRVFGFLALPQGQQMKTSILPAWLIPESFRQYPPENYFNYVINLRAGTQAKAKIPIEIKKFTRNQSAVYSQVYLQLIQGQVSFWNIFRLEPGYSGPIIASKEDITSLE